MRDVVMASPQMDDLTTALRAAGAHVRATQPGAVRVEGLDAVEIGSIAAHHQVTLSELSPRRASLEEAFMELTRSSVEFHANAGPIGQVAA